MTTTTTAAGGAAAGSPTSAAKTSRHRGVGWCRQKQKWRAKICVEGEHRHLGLFDDEDEAAQAYAAACRDLGRDPDPAQSSRHVGVSWLKGEEKWRAQIKVDGKSQSLGCFDDEDEAARAYQAAARGAGPNPARKRRHEAAAGESAELALESAPSSPSPAPRSPRPPPAPRKLTGDATERVAAPPPKRPRLVAAQPRAEQPLAARQRRRRPRATAA